jgi:hypothetical protein
MTGTNPLLDPDGSKRAAMAATLEYGTHPLIGQHLYRQPVPSTPAARHDAQQALDRPVATIPRCPRCNRQRVLFQGTCGTCGDAEREEYDQ